MKRIIGEVIQESNVYIDGQGYLGVVRNLKLPDIEQEMIETKGALGANYGTGVLKPLEINFKIAVADPVLFAAYFHTTYSEIKAPLLFRESVHRGEKTTELLQSSWENLLTLVKVITKVAKKWKWK